MNSAGGEESGKGKEKFDGRKRQNIFEETATTRLSAPSFLSQKYKSFGEFVDKNVLISLENINIHHHLPIKEQIHK